MCLLETLVSAAVLYQLGPHVAVLYQAVDMARAEDERCIVAHEVDVHQHLARQTLDTGQWLGSILGDFAPLAWRFALLWRHGVCCCSTLVGQWWIVEM